MEHIISTPEFEYSHRNPYHDKLDLFSEFVIRDKESECFQGFWNEQVFKRQAPLMLEVGSGYGHFMTEYCANNPDINFVGMDLRFKRTFNLARKLNQFEQRNFRFLRARGERIQYIFGPGEVDSIFYFFPDPWPKRRQHKKRLFQAPFLASAAKILRPGGKLYIKTDHHDYALWMEKTIAEDKLFNCELKTFDLHSEFPEHLLARYITKFEKIFLAQDTPTKAFVLEKPLVK